MGRFAGVWHALGVKSARSHLLFGAVCAVLGASAVSLAWLAFRGPSETPREFIGVGVHSNAGLVGEVIPDPDGLPLAHVPIHKRSDYRVAPPDILSIQCTAPSADAPDEEMRAISGETLIQPDGTIELGNELGSLQVQGLTTSEIQTAIEERANDRDWHADVSVFAQNSKVYYLIVEGGAGQGDEVQRHTVVGDESVLDVLSQVEQSAELKNKRIWIARPQPGVSACDSILQVNWKEITGGGATATNYQVFPGDRIFVSDESPQAEAATQGKNKFPVKRSPYQSY